MDEEKIVYHVIKCQKGPICELLSFFNSKEEAYKFQKQKEKEIQDDTVIIGVYPVKING